MLQSFRPRFECRNRGKPLSCALSRLFSLACSREGRRGEGEDSHQIHSLLGPWNLRCNTEMGREQEGQQYPLSFPEASSHS